VTERSRTPRPLLILGGLALVVVIASALTIALNGGIPGAANVSPPTPAASLALGNAGPATADPASALPATADPTLIAVASSSPIPGGSPASSLVPTDGPGIRAKQIQIARLGIDLPIVEGDGIDAPLTKAAHYPGTGWPDGGTNIYIYAHARTGLFLTLWNAQVGDRVDLTLVDGTKRTFVVDQVLPKVPMDATGYLQPTATEQLTLQTSTGPDENDPRFVVIAHPAP
jgi:LPXTG-site transpeptidase (sortase) family protein